MHVTNITTILKHYINIVSYKNTGMCKYLSYIYVVRTTPQKTKQ